MTFVIPKGGNFSIRWRVMIPKSLLRPHIPVCIHLIVKMLSFLGTLLGLAFSGIIFATPLPSDSHSLDKRSVVERDGVTYNVFEHRATGAKMEFVTNSGICETTPGVNQYSGYLSVGPNQNMWFWL